MANKSNLKLVYVLKVGKNSKGEGMYEFLFSEDTAKILDMADEWNWLAEPAYSDGNALCPDIEYIDEVLELKTNQFDLWCLHADHLGKYMDGVYTIHCLAYEIENEDDDEYEYEFEDMFDDSESSGDISPLLVFHFGMTKKEVEDILYRRDIQFENQKRRIAAK
jgi:hypothetical protein